MTKPCITYEEAAFLRDLGAQVEAVEAQHQATARESDLGTGDLTRQALALASASAVLDGMIAAADATGLFTRVGHQVRSITLSGLPLADEDYADAGVQLVSL